MSLAAWLDKQEQCDPSFCTIMTNMISKICTCSASDSNVHTGSIAVSTDGLTLPQTYELWALLSSTTLYFGLRPLSPVQFRKHVAGLNRRRPGGAIESPRF